MDVHLAICKATPSILSFYPEPVSHTAGLGREDANEVAGDVIEFPLEPL